MAHQGDGLPYNASWAISFNGQGKFSMNSFLPEAFPEHLITPYIDPPNLQWHMFHDAYEDSMTPWGYDSYFALALGWDALVELHIRDEEAYTSTPESYLIIRGQWQLQGFTERSFVIQIINPQFDVRQDGGDVAKYRQHFLDGKSWTITPNLAG